MTIPLRGIGVRIKAWQCGSIGFSACFEFVTIGITGLPSGRKYRIPTCPTWARWRHGLASSP